MGLSIPSEQLQIVQSILQKHVPQRSVLAFGSRVQGNAKPYSDLDLVILGNEPLSIAEHADLTSDFSESDLPWKVDIVDWCLISDEFRQIIQQQYYELQKMKKLSFPELAIKVMREFNRPATVDELWQYVQEKQLYIDLEAYDANRGGFKGKTPDITFCARIYTLAKQGRYFKEVGNASPKQFVLLEHSLPKHIDVEQRLNASDTTQAKKQIKERELHKFLSHYLYHNKAFGAYSRTIFHESSKKGQKGEDKWLYPDMVAVHFEYEGYQHHHVLSFVKKFDILPVKVFSFELKRDLGFSNYKQSFFQAVSNSSWANEGYLVALNIDSDSQFLEALQKLSQSFGIGIIQLDIVQIENSRVISPARYKEKMDYSVVNELASKNEDFKDFLKTVTDFDPKSKERFLSEFDPILTAEKLNDTIY